MRRSSAILVLTIWPLSPLYSNTVCEAAHCATTVATQRIESQVQGEIDWPPLCVKTVAPQWSTESFSRGRTKLACDHQAGTKRSPWWWLKPGLALSTPPGGQIISHTLTSWHGQDVRDSSYICFAFDAKNSKFFSKYNQQYPSQVFVKELQDHTPPQAAERW